MKAIRALMLVLALSVCAYAGDMPNGRAGDMPNDKTGEMDNGKTTPTDSITESVLLVLQSVLPLF
jgi:hypothetical protein